MATKRPIPGIMAPARKKVKKVTTTTTTTTEYVDPPARSGLHVHVLVDQSSSMNSVKSSTISAVNEYLDTLSPEEVPTRVTVQMFHANNGMHKSNLCVNSSPATARRLDGNNYNPQGMTPLRDAIGSSIHEIDRLGLPSSHGVVLVIQTDGQENQSKEYTQPMIRDMIEDRRRRGWMVIFLAANQDAVLVGADYGIPRANSMTYNMGNEGIALASVGRSTRSYAGGQSVESSGFTDEERTKATL